MSPGDGIAMAGFLIAVGTVVAAVILATTWLKITGWDLTRGRARSEEALAPPSGPAKSGRGQQSPARAPKPPRSSAPPPPPPPRAGRREMDLLE